MLLLGVATLGLLAKIGMEMIAPAGATEGPYRAHLPAISRHAQPGLTVAVAGDIACDPADRSFRAGAGTEVACAQQRTSDLLLRIKPNAVLVAGDAQYNSGGFAQFQQSYDPSWGRLKSITHPAIGNHEYGTSQAAGYFDYFGAAAGDRSKGYYAFDIGSWRVYALNSNCRQIGGCDANSAQFDWLSADLDANPRACSIAYWHHPRFSSGPHGDSPAMQDIWRTLHERGVDLVFAGHDHDYERFAPMDANGKLDPAHGIRSFVVGTGGRSHYAFKSVKPNSEVRNGDTFGVLQLNLSEGSYQWQFLAEPGKSFADAGSEACGNAVRPTA